jgi:hypothetical protein
MRVRRGGYPFHLKGTGAKASQMLRKFNLGTFGATTKPFSFLYQCPYQKLSTRTTITMTTTRTTHFAQSGIVLRADNSALPLWSFPAACARALLSTRFPSGAMRTCPIGSELWYLHRLSSPMVFSEAQTPFISSSPSQANRRKESWPLKETPRTPFLPCRR